MWNKFKKYFITGLLVFLPFALTVYLLFLAINFADSLLGRYLEPHFFEIFGVRYFTGLGLLLGIYLITLVGFFVTNFFGRRIFEFFDNLMIKLPFFKQVYPALKEMAHFLFSREQLKNFKQVVIVEYPRKGIYTVGFLTNDSSPMIREKTKKDLCNVFIPSSPGPLTGFTIMVPQRDIIYTDMSIESSFKFIVSGGVVNPN